MICCVYVISILNGKVCTNFVTNTYVARISPSSYVVVYNTVLRKPAYKTYAWYLPQVNTPYSYHYNN